MEVQIKDICRIIGEPLKGSPPLFEKEDAELLSDFGLGKLKDSYEQNKLVPDEISKAVGDAYARICSWGNEKKESYLSESSLGRKIWSAIEHDHRFIVQFCRPLYDMYTKIDPKQELKDKEWKPKLKVQAVKGKSKDQVDALEKLAEDCHERIKRYVSKDLPKEWS